jgi:hypothetical protein
VPLETANNRSRLAPTGAQLAHAYSQIVTEEAASPPPDFGLKQALTPFSTDEARQLRRYVQLATELKESAFFQPQARIFPMHQKVLGTEPGLRQRVAAACKSRPGDEPNA